MLAPLLIFLLTYAAIAFGRLSRFPVDRTSATLAGAVLMVALGGLPLAAAYRGIDFDTLLLLLGMMLVIGHLSTVGLIDWFAARVMRWGRGPNALLFLLVVASGLLSALFVNDTICLLLTPIVLQTASRLGLPPVPYLIGLAAASNIGGVMSITGNPQNMLIGIRSGIPFARFFLLLLPVAALGLLFEAAALSFLYREALSRPGPSSQRAVTPSLDIRSARRGIAVVIAMLVLFVLGYPYPFVALGAGGVLLFAGGKRPQEIFRRVDWRLLVFFGALFVVMKGLEQSGWLGVFMDTVPRVGSGRAGREAFALGSLAVVLSNLISNVPAVVLLEPFVRQLSRPELAWLTLAMASTLAGNLTLIGSVANLIVVSLARPRVEITFFEYLKVGLVLTPVTFLIGVMTLLLEVRLGWI